MPRTVRETIDRALDAYASLVDVGETLEDEWTYVNGLAEAWRARLSEVAVERGDEPATGELGSAVDRALAEIAAISDPHRAVDWLSTFPQVVLLATGEQP